MSDNNPVAPDRTRGLAERMRSQASLLQTAPVTWTELQGARMLLSEGADALLASVAPAETAEPGDSQQGGVRCGDSITVAPGSALTVAPDRETVARIIFDFGGAWSLEMCLELADALLASGVLGVNPTPGQAVTLHAYTDADLDTIRAETLEEAADDLPGTLRMPSGGVVIDYMGTYGGWLRTRAAKYRTRS